MFKQLSIYSKSRKVWKIKYDWYIVQQLIRIRQESDLYMHPAVLFVYIFDCGLLLIYI